ncbi:SRPBCC family protein [Solirubrobacter ginsenosidimutans]|uniref:SRPBCC family protein n=1 Tax=Solirubrobacter ginsenosidimutans TaxID=490573 RepID=A0A9X3MYV5_9ACTN|nr:SRPBCC family protein [Solirubrobacter ginsenosidimutans]MDA0165289.1 SRPBCC family protein [Solirubrobacter ginsenosidimutans]
MKLENEFTVPASIDQAWAVLLDVPRVAPCLPGATVEEGQGEEGEYKGQMKIKIGPITASYKGTVKIQEADEAAHRVAMRAQAKDARGQGTAAATITSTMEEVADGTKIHVTTDMRVTGPAAQFGRGVMQDVSAKLMTRFAECLADQMQAAPAATTEEAPAAAEGATNGSGPAETAADVAPAEAVEAAPAEVGAAAEAAPAEAEAAAPTDTTPAEPATTVEDGVPGASSGVSSAEAEPAAPSASSGTSSAAPKAAAPRPTDDVLDLGEASRDALLKRAVPLVAGIVGLLILIRLIKR